MISPTRVLDQNSTHTQWRNLIDKGSNSLRVTLTQDQLSLLVSYVEQLVKWNKAYNLTAIRDPLQMIKLHIFDSLAVAESLSKLSAERIIDIGTGAGLPGMVLAILWPHKNIHLLDTNGKKTRFLTHFKHLHQLNNVEIFNHRCENYLPDSGYDIIISRAFASVADMLEGCQQLVSDKGVFVAMKGAYPHQELDAMPANYSLLHCEILQVPGVDAKRHLLTIKKQLT
jgi:16S rRNA (guanine527-N7)-methyltransferase